MLKSRQTILLNGMHVKSLFQAKYNYANPSVFACRISDIANTNPQYKCDIIDMADTVGLIRMFTTNFSENSNI
jgi:hypothetical protein